MEKASYGTSIFGEQFLRKSGLACDSSEIGIASLVFGKAPEAQPPFNDIPQLQTGVGEREMFRPFRMTSYVHAVPPYLCCQHKAA